MSQHYSVDKIKVKPAAPIHGTRNDRKAFEDAMTTTVVRRNKNESVEQKARIRRAQEGCY